MLRDRRTRRTVASLALAGFVVLWVPAGVAAHAELVTADPADGSTVPSTFEGPIVMTFSAALADGSKADLHGPDGSVVASAFVDGPGATMTITLEATLQPAFAPGDYEVRWVSVADDGDLERGTVAFTVASAAATTSPTATPVASTAAGTSAPASSAAASAAPSASTAPSPSPTPGSGNADTGTADVLLPIIVALIVVGAGAIFLLGRRNRADSLR